MSLTNWANDHKKWRSLLGGGTNSTSKKLIQTLYMAFYRPKFMISVLQPEKKYVMKHFKTWLGQIEQWNSIFYNTNSVAKCSLGNFFKVHSNWDMKSHCKQHIWGTFSFPQSHWDLLFNTFYLLGSISIVLVGLLIIF